VLAGVFFVISAIFVYRSFYGMRIKAGEKAESKTEAKAPSAEASSN
jgi:K(+)-stimulated pyrophosphate-energized sodium pump